MLTLGGRANFDVFERAMMKLSEDQEPGINNVLSVLAALTRFLAKMLALGGWGSMVIARQREAVAVRRRQRQRTVSN